MDCRSVCRLRCASKARLPEALEEASRHYFVDTRDRAKACGLDVSWEGDRCKAGVGGGRCRKTVSKETRVTQYCAKHQRAGRSLAEPGDRDVEAVLPGLAPEEGDEYEGERDAQHRYHGNGTLRTPDGAVYRGSFLRGRFHGMGHHDSPAVWSDIQAETYIGQDLHGERHGKGMLTLGGRRRHVSEFFCGDIHGHCVIEDLITGTRIEGSFKHKNLHGLAVVSRGGDYLYQGMWRNGRRDGFGVAIQPDGSRVGQFSRNTFHGAGEFHAADGRVYKGQFHGAIPHGIGVVEGGGGQAGRRSGRWSRGVLVEEF